MRISSGTPLRLGRVLCRSLDSLGLFLDSSSKIHTGASGSVLVVLFGVDFFVVTLLGASDGRLSSRLKRSAKPLVSPGSLASKPISCRKIEHISMHLRYSDATYVKV